MSLTLPPSPPHRPPARTEPLHIPTVAEPPRPGCPDPGAHYRCDTVGGLDAAVWQRLLAERFAAGYRLDEVVRGDGEGALLVFCHRED